MQSYAYPVQLCECEYANDKGMFIHRIEIMGHTCLFDDRLCEEE